MADIKTREAVKGTIKTIDRAAVVLERMKAVYVKTKDNVEQGSYAGENSATEYAANQTSHTANRVKDEGIHQIKKLGKKSVQTTGENTGKAKNKVADFKQKRAMEAAEQKKAQAAGERNGSQIRHGTVSRSPAPDAPANGKRRLIKTRQQGEKTVKTTARKTGKAVKSATKGTVKTTEKGIKTAHATSKAAIKTTEQTAKATKVAAKASAKAAQRAAQTAKVTAKATVHAVKVAVKATVTATKAIIATTKALISAIVAGGWIAILAIVIICLIGLIASSSFGIFFSGEDSGTGQTIRTVVREINQEYEDKLEEIKTGNAHDLLEMSGSRAVWSDVLAIFAVKTTTDPNNPQEVATMDDNKKELLREIFWKMNRITYEVIEEVLPSPSEPASQPDEPKRILHITTSCQTAPAMADIYGFSPAQLAALDALLGDNDGLWNQLMGVGNDDIVSLAVAQLGNSGNTYWSWYGFNYQVSWCGCFVSWCASETGYLDAGIIPKFSWCDNGIAFFKEQNLWQGRSYVPNPGDIIFFDWDSQNGVSDHVGIVAKVEGNMVVTIEGNVDDRVTECHWRIGDRRIMGYGTPAYITVQPEQSQIE